MFMGAIAKTEQAEVSFTMLMARGFSTREVIQVMAEDRAFAKHEHALKMGMAEYAYEIRDGRLYSSSSQVFFDELIDPPAHKRTSGYPPMPDHVIENLREAQRLLVSGNINSLALLSPSLDFQAEGSNKGQVYFMRRVGNQIYVVSTDHSESSEQMQKEAASLYGIMPERSLAGNVTNGGGIFAVTRPRAPTRQEVLAAVKEHGNEALAQQYENAIYLGEGVSPQEYLAKLIERESNDIYQYLKKQGISLSENPNEALRVAFRYVDRELQAIKEQIFSGTESSVSQVYKPSEMLSARNSFNELRDSTQLSSSFDYTVAVNLDYGRMKGDALYRVMREAELQSAGYSELRSFVKIEKEVGIADIRPIITAAAGVVAMNSIENTPQAYSAILELEAKNKRIRDRWQSHVKSAQFSASSKEPSSVSVIVSEPASQENVKNNRVRGQTDKVLESRVFINRPYGSDDVSVQTPRFSNKPPPSIRESYNSVRSSKENVGSLLPQFRNYKDTPIKLRANRFKKFVNQYINRSKSDNQRVGKAKSINQKSKPKKGTTLNNETKIKLGQVQKRYKSFNRSQNFDQKVVRPQKRLDVYRYTSVASIVSKLKSTVRKFSVAPKLNSLQKKGKRDIEIRSKIKIDAERSQVYRSIRSVVRGLQIREKLASRVIQKKVESLTEKFRSRIYELAKIRLIIGSLRKLEVTQIRFPKQKLIVSLSILKELVAARRLAIKLLLKKRLSPSERQAEGLIRRDILRLEKRFHNTILQLRKSPALRQYLRFFVSKGSYTVRIKNTSQLRARRFRFKNGSVALRYRSTQRLSPLFSFSQLAALERVVYRYQRDALLSSGESKNIIRLIALARYLRGKYVNPKFSLSLRAKRRLINRLRRLEKALNLFLCNLLSSDFYASMRADAIDRDALFSFYDRKSSPFLRENLEIPTK